MENGRKYWLSPQRGLPPPSGRLGGGIAYPEMGVVEAPWDEEEPYATRLPQALYLQSGAERLEAIQQAARVQRFLQQAGERTQLAFGPGASGGLPPTEYLDTGERTMPQPGMYVAPQPGMNAASPLVNRPAAAQQLWGEPAGAGDPAMAGAGYGGLRPGMRPIPVDDPYVDEQDFGNRAYATMDDSAFGPMQADDPRSPPTNWHSMQSGFPGASVATGPSGWDMLNQPYPGSNATGWVPGTGQSGTSMPYGLASPAAGSAAGFAGGGDLVGRPRGYSAQTGDIQGGEAGNPGFFAMQARRDWIAGQSADQAGKFRF